MRRRRLFRPARPPFRWGKALLLGGAAGLGVLILGFGLPAELMGSAPRNPEWRAEAADVRVLDGDTLRLGDRTLRLYGLDAPERGQQCVTPAGQTYDCGGAAAAALAQLVAERPVTCRLHGRDRFGRALGICQAEGMELNASLVSAGWALADASRQPSLVPLEAAARARQSGLWAGGFTPPAHWRSGR